MQPGTPPQSTLEGRQFVVLVGGGGHARSVIEVIESTSAFVVAGYVDLPSRQAQDLLEYPWLGSDDDLATLAIRYPWMLVTAGHMGIPKLRERLAHLVAEAGARAPTIRSVCSRVSRHATVGPGTVVMHQAVVNAGATVGSNCIINTSAVIEHDSTVGDQCHISTGAILNGHCVVASRCFVGSGTRIREGVRLAEGTITGAGAVVLRDTEPYGVYVGVPARRIGSSTP